MQILLREEKNGTVKLVVYQSEINESIWMNEGNVLMFINGFFRIYFEMSLLVKS